VQQLLSPFHPLPDALKSWHFLKRPHEEAVDKTKSCGVPLFVSCIPTTHILVHSTYLEFHPRPDFPIKVELGPRRKQQLFSLQGLGVRLLTFGLVGWIVFPSRNERLIPLSSKSSIEMSSQDQQTPAGASTSTAVESARQQIVTDDNLPCQWDKCNERCDSAEALYVSSRPVMSMPLYSANLT
jgi:hypothetical protein